MEIKYTEHLELRLKLRGFPYDLPKDICEGAEEYYYDINYDSGSDTLYIFVREGAEEEFIEVADGISIELNEDKES